MDQLLSSGAVAIGVVAFVVIAIPVIVAKFLRNVDSNATSGKT